MLDGKYTASLNTPVGSMRGTVTLKCDQNNVQGILEIMGMKNNFNGIKTKENECNFKGNLNIPIGNIDYEAKCIVIGDKLELLVNSQKGDFKIIGERVS